MDADSPLPRAPRSARVLLLAALLPALGLACQLPRPVHDWSTYEGPGQRYFQREEIEFPSVPDPLEPLNRTVWDLNSLGLRKVVGPLATAYRALVPGFVRKSTARFFTNVSYPVRLVNDLLQGKLRGAWTETERFAVNTTAGVLGLGDPASSWGIGRAPEDFGQTLAAWGWDHSTYLVLPFFGPRTVRDSIGLAGDTYSDPAHYFFPAIEARNWNELSDKAPGLVQFMRTTYDPYELARLLYVMNRENDVEDYSYRSEDGSATETLAAVFLGPHDPDFARSGETHTVRDPATGRELPYTVWLQPKPAPVIYLLPGLGSHRLSDSPVALAEAAYTQGISAVTISSTMNHEFIADGLSAELPGFLPSDSHDVHVALDAIDSDLRARVPGLIGERWLAGVSLGAITTLFIAAAEEDPANRLIDFDAYLAIDSPVDMEHALRQLDAFYDAPLSYPRAERAGRIAGIYRKTLDLAQGLLTPTGKLPFTELEAKFLIGLAFRSNLRDVIFQTQRRHDLGILFADLHGERREAAYREISQFSFFEYVFAFLLPYYAIRRPDVSLDEAGAERLFRLSSLRSIGSALAKNPKVRFASNENDFLLRPEDITWIRQLLGPDRVRFFPTGGHLGNLGRAEIRQALGELLRDAAKESDGEEPAGRRAPGPEHAAMSESQTPGA